VGLSELGSSLSETFSPKRDVVIKLVCCLHCSSGELVLGVWASDDLAQANRSRLSEIT